MAIKRKNPIPKLAEETPEEVASVAPTEEKKTISPLDLDLGREDLNALVAKVNELVEALNK